MDTTVPAPEPKPKRRNDDALHSDGRGHQGGPNRQRKLASSFSERQNTAIEKNGCNPVGTNYEAKVPKLQRLSARSTYLTTIAVEVPIWLMEEDIAAIERLGHSALLERATATRRRARRAQPPAISTSCKSATARSTSSATNPTRPPGSRSDPAHPLCARALALDRHPALRFQVRVVQRASIL